MAEQIDAVSISKETRKGYLIYALSVITSRALPDVRDGLKPVQRRILYDMYHELGLRSDAKPAKCARIIGDVMGKFHPHGDSAIYDAMVRMAQDFKMRMPLVHGQGNFGSVDGDPAAAYRYTEAKLTTLADNLLTELRQRTVDMRPTYDSATEEPVVVPAQFPNILVNGADGIAVGMATNIPPHNLGELVRACIQLIDDPDTTTAVLLDKVKGPDFPLGGKIVTDRPTLRSIYEEGTGSIKVQAEWEVEENGKKKQIIITSIPHGVNKGALELDIGEIINGRKLPQLTGLANESSTTGNLRIALDIKSDADPQIVMAYLYKHTALQENFSYNMTCLVPTPDGKLQPQRLGLKAILRHFLDFRFLTVKRRFEFELEQLRRRIHILEGFRIIFDALDKAIRIIRESSGKADASTKLMDAFGLDAEQTNAILEAQLYKIAQMEIKKILDELKEKQAEAARIEGILRSDKKLWNVVKTEMEALAEEHSNRRRTRMASGEDIPEFDEQAYIVRENTNVVLTRDGWIKRVGRLASVEGTRVREGDEVVAVAPGSTLDHVVFFADDGTAFTMRINETPASSGYGEPIGKYYRIDDRVKILTALTADPRFIAAATPPEGPDLPAGPYLLVVTAQGQTLRAPFAPFRLESTKVGRRYIKLNEGDRVVMVAVPRDEVTIYLASAQGRVLHFAISDINILSGVGKGVMGIKLTDGDECLGGALMGGRFDKFTLETSGGKTMEFGRAKYEVTSRGGKGFEAVKRTNFVRVVPPPIELVNWDELEGKTNGKSRESGENAQPGTLF
jgi:DNA gyrase subunit A